MVVNFKSNLWLFLIFDHESQKGPAVVFKLQIIDHSKFLYFSSFKDDKKYDKIFGLFVDQIISCLE
jgi:hypothetical protein